MKQLFHVFQSEFGLPPQTENFSLHLKVLTQSIYNAYTLCEHSNESYKMLTNIIKKTKIMTTPTNSNSSIFLQFTLYPLIIKDILENYYFQALALSDLSPSTNAFKPLELNINFKVSLSNLSTSNNKFETFFSHTSQPSTMDFKPLSLSPNIFQP